MMRDETPQPTAGGFAPTFVARNSWFLFPRSRIQRPMSFSDSRPPPPVHLP